MKNSITGIVLLVCIATLQVRAQSTTLAKDTEWLEKQLNALALASKTDTKVKQFSFDNCHCEFKAQDTKGGGFNFNMNYAFDLNEITSVSYAANDDKSYDLIVKLKTDNKDNVFNFNSFNTTLYTSNENQVKEIVKTFKSSIKTCSTGN
jgi:hypothetical protein